MIDHVFWHFFFVITAQAVECFFSIGRFLQIKKMQFFFDNIIIATLMHQKHKQTYFMFTMLLLGPVQIILRSASKVSPNVNYVTI